MSGVYVSIIMPFYNVDIYINEAIRSILDQTFQDFELIVINDGSTDLSLSIVQVYADSDQRIRVISQSNQGLSAARNKGLAHAKGQYVYFFDSDDLLEKNTFAICVDYIQRLNLDLIAFSGQAFADNDSSYIERFSAYQKPKIVNPISGLELLSKLYHKKSYSSSVCLFIASRHLINKNYLTFDEGFLHEDEAFTVALYCFSQRSISLSNPFFKRRVRENSIMMAPRSFENIKGWVQAVVKIDQFIIKHSDLVNLKTKKVLRSIQFRLLRLSRNIAEKISEVNLFVSLVRNNLSGGQLINIDLSMFFYTRMNWLFFKLRLFKRKYFNVGC